MTAPALAAVLALSSTLGLHHEEDAVHVRCAEHGELVHVERAQPSEAAERIDGLARYRAAPDAAAGDAHDHCDEAWSTRDPEPMAASARSDGHLWAASTSRRLAEGVPARAGPLHRIAPKQSPPC